MIRAVPQGRIKTLSLFSGAGGLDIGFHKAGFDIVGCVELEPIYAKTLEANSGRGKLFGSSNKIHCMDIRGFDPKPYENIGIECVIGGPPCQTFSAAGRRSGGVLGTIDARGRLFESYCRILKAIQPKVFVFENVYGLPGANGGGPWREICDAFSKLGYSMKAEVLDAADYGVPQNRERLIIVGYKDPLGDFIFPLPTHGPDSLSGEKLISVLDAIFDLQNEAEPYHDFDGLYGHLLPLVPEGLNYSFFTREMGYPKPFFAWRSKFHDFLYKVDRNAPCRTIKAQPGKFTGPFHWKNRHFTIPELKRLQSFPDNYEIIGSYGKVVEQIGNSVPPQLAEVVAVSVREQLLRVSAKKKYKPRPEGFKSTFRQRQRERTNEYKLIAKNEVASRFPNVQLLEKRKVDVAGSYFVGYEGFFSKTRVDDVSDKTLGVNYFSVDELRSGSSISICVAPVHPTGRKFKEISIEISGLEKYLITVDSLSCRAKLSGPSDLFFIWGIIEKVLTKESHFYTLIDIYGHYANRGDTVKIETRFIGAKKSRIEKAFEFFGNSENCGSFINIEDLFDAIGVSDEQIPALVSSFRLNRWDLRTADTHSTIRGRSLLCTYPFPLLSGKAQLERRINEA